MMIKIINEMAVKAAKYFGNSFIKALLLFLILWLGLPILIKWLDETAGLLDPGIWQLLLLTIISYMIVLALSWQLLHWIWHQMGLPKLTDMVLQFKNLILWQQFALFWASFALLLLSGVLSLIAVF